MQIAVRSAFPRHNLVTTWMRRVMYAPLTVVVLGAAVVADLLWYKPAPFQIASAGKRGELG